MIVGDIILPLTQNQTNTKEKEKDSPKRVVEIQH